MSGSSPSLRRQWQALFWVGSKLTMFIHTHFTVNVNPMYKTEELSYAIDKVGIKALLAPPSFRRSNYYKTLLDIIPDMATHAENRSNLSSDSFPKLKHIIIFDSVDGRAYRLVLCRVTFPISGHFDGQPSQIYNPRFALNHCF